MVGNTDAAKASDQESVDVTSSSEPWSEYKLSDGTILRIKTVVVEVRRSKNQYNADGDPVYTVKSANLLDTRVPTSLKKKQ